MVERHPPGIPLRKAVVVGKRMASLIFIEPWIISGMENFEIVTFYIVYY